MLPLALVLVAGPAPAQVDLSGDWRNVVPEDPVHRRSILNGDYTGVPINDAGRYKAESWDQAVQALHERQCIPHPVTYAMRGFPASSRISTINVPETGQIIAELNRIIDLTIPADWQEGGTMVIPGHGRISDEADVVEYRDMVTIIRDRIQDMIRGGLTLDQVQAGRPSQDYDGRYGATAGPWTTEMFIESIYHGLASQLQ